MLWRVSDGRLPGARRIGETARHSRRLLRRCEVDGDGMVVHALGGRPSNRALSGEVRESELAIAAEPVSADCGPTLHSEHLESGYGPRVKPYTSLQWKPDDELWEGEAPVATSPPGCAGRAGAVGPAVRTRGSSTGRRVNRSALSDQTGRRTTGLTYRRLPVPPKPRMHRMRSGTRPGSSRHASPTHRLRGGRRLDRCVPLPQADRRGSPGSAARRPGCPKG